MPTLVSTSACGARQAGAAAGLAPSRTAASASVLHFSPSALPRPSPGPDTPTPPPRAGYARGQVSTRGGAMAKIKHIALSTQDPDATAKFYVDVFGMKQV